MKSKGTIVLPCWTPDNYKTVHVKLHGIEFIVKQVEPKLGGF